jgi:hypothetical protein
MEKAYDLKDLGKKLQEQGLPIAEEALQKAGKQAYTAVKAWLKESAVMSSNKVDDILAPFLDQADPVVNKAIDGLDLDHDGQ